jgi:hypothetical protein
VLRRACVLPAALTLLVVAGCGGGEGHHARTSTHHPAPPTTTTSTSTATTAPTAAPAPVPPPPPASVAFSWQAAGAFVAHPTDVDPEVLANQLRANGFGWVAVLINDGTSATLLDPVWIERFRRAGGLALGGWGVLRTDPEREAALAREMTARYSLDFYIADAEAEYGYSGQNGPSGARYGRSRRFVDAWRHAEPDLPSGLVSYCRPDRHDIDWRAWSNAGFAFLPEAYVNEHGLAASPQACVEGAKAVFPLERVHPLIGVYQGRLGTGSPGAYARLLEQARTVGFSVYLAETGMTDAKWAAFGKAITQQRIAVRPRSGQ